MVEPADVVDITGLSSAPTALIPRSPLSFALHPRRTEVTFEFGGSAARVADQAPEISGPLAAAKQIARELTTPEFRLSCYTMTRYKSPRVFVEIKGKDAGGEPWRKRYAFTTEQDAIACMRGEHAALSQSPRSRVQVTDADIAAGELEYEIDERLRAVFPERE